MFKARIDRVEAAGLLRLSGLELSGVGANARSADALQDLSDQLNDRSAYDIAAALRSRQSKEALASSEASSISSPSGPIYPSGGGMLHR